MGYIAFLECSVCRAHFPADSLMNLCPHDQRPVQIVLDLERLKAAKGRDSWWNPAEKSLWRFGGLLPLDLTDPSDIPYIVNRREGHTPSVAYYEYPAAKSAGIRLEIKDEGRHYPGWGGNPTLSFKDRGMAMTVSMARRHGLKKLAVPTQGNAGDSLADYATPAGLEVAVIMSPDTDRPVMGNVAALAALFPENVHLELIPGTIVDCAARMRKHWLPQGYFNVATFQEPGWRTEGKKTLGLEMAEPVADRLPDGRWELPDVIIYPTGGGTGVVGMAKAFDELETLGLISDKRPRMICVQSEASTPIVRAWEAGDTDISPLPAGNTVATGLNVARNPGHINVLKIIRSSGGMALSVDEPKIRQTIREEWLERRFAWSPEGAAALAAVPRLLDHGMIRPGDRVVVVNTASAEKYLPTIREELGGGF
jgi:threonine synthase